MFARSDGCCKRIATRKSGAHRRGRRRSIGWVAFETDVYAALDGRLNAVDQTRELLRTRLFLKTMELGHRLGLESALSRKDLVANEPEDIKVTLLRDFLASALLGRHVGGRSTPNIRFLDIVDADC